MSYKDDENNINDLFEDDLSDEKENEASADSNESTVGDIEALVADALNEVTSQILDEDIKEAEDEIKAANEADKNKLSLFAELEKREYDDLLKKDSSPRSVKRAGELETASLRTEDVVSVAKQKELAERDDRRRAVREREAAIEDEFHKEDEKALQKKYSDARKKAQERNKEELREQKVQAHKEKKERNRKKERDASNRKRRKEDLKRRKKQEKASARSQRARDARERNERKRQRKSTVQYYRNKEKEGQRMQSLKDENAKTLENEKSPLRKLIENVIYVVVIVLIALFVVNFVVQKTVVDGSSMYPTVEDGNQLIMEKVTYRFGDPDRFDIVVIRVPDDGNKKYIKRIIGLPGETVQITDGVIYINGEVLEEDYGYETMSYSGRAYEPITLGEDEYFVLGDNRNNSTDSRYDIVGNVSKDNILGHAVLRIWPISEFGTID